MILWSVCDTLGDHAVLKVCSVMSELKLRICLFMFVSVLFACHRTAPARLGRWNNRRVRLTEEEARARLAGAQVARLATAGADGQPYLVPVTFAVDDDLIYITVDHKPKTTTKLKRLRNIREDPRVGAAGRPLRRRLGRALVGPRRRLGEHRRGRARGRAPDRRAGGRYEQYRDVRPAGPVIVIQADNWSGWSST